MSFKKVKTDAFYPVCMTERAVSVMGPLNDWEKEEIENSYDDFGSVFLKIAHTKQTSIPRTMKWLKMSAEEGCEEGVITYASLLHSLNPDLQYKGDEAAWWMKRMKEEKLMEKVRYFDPDGSRACRHLTRLLLSGSLSKNQDSVIYRSFFRSGLREVHLLPLIVSKYLVDGKKRENERREVNEEESEEEREGMDDEQHVSSFSAIISTLGSIVDLIYSSSSSTSFISSLELILEYDNQFLSFLPLLFSLLPHLNELIFASVDLFCPQFVNLSLLQQADTSKLEILDIYGCSFDSLSPLSLCDLSCFRTLSLRELNPYEGFHPLNGISSDITRSLKKLEVTSSDLEDLSPLSDCDLSSLVDLNLSSDSSLSSLSPLRGSDLSSLKYLSLRGTNISDLSPLCECKGLALEELDLVETPIEDLSPLSLLDLSRLRRPIDLRYLMISDLSPLGSIACDGVEVNIDHTVAARKMEEEGLKSPQTIGKVTVRWRWL